MPTAEARIETDRPSRHLARLCEHADLGRFGRHDRLTVNWDGTEYPARKPRGEALRPWRPQGIRSQDS